MQPTRIERFLDRRAIVLALFASLSILLTLPLIFRFTSQLPAGSGDIWQNYWNLWWWKKALFELGEHPYHTKLLFYPRGADLIFHTHSPFNMLATMPVNLWLGMTAAYNFSLLLSLTLSGYGGWLLGREVSGDTRGGVLAGLVFAFFPQHIEQTFEHINLYSTQFLPWALYYLLRVLRDGGRGAAIGLGVTFGLNALCSWHLGIKLVLSIVFVLVGYLAGSARPLKKVIGDLALAALTAALVTAPFVAPLLVEIASGAEYYQKGATDRGIDPTYLLTPHYGHPLWGGLAMESYRERAYGAAGFVCYLGFAPLALAAWALIRRQPKAWFWAGFTLAMLILALSSPMWWDGELVEGLWLPFELIRSAPGLSVLRVANRFLILTSLGLGTLAALGWKALPRRSDGVFLAVAGLVVLEYAWLPYPLQKVEIPPAYHQMVDGPLLRIGAVLDIPFYQRSRTAMSMVAQTLHGRPLVAGYLSTISPYTEGNITEEPALADLMDVPKLERPIDFRRLVQLGIDTVVLHKKRAESYARRAAETISPDDMHALKAAERLGGIPEEKMAEIRRQLEQYCGPAEFEDDEVAIFYLPAAAGL